MLTQASGCLCHYVHTEMANFILSFGASYCWHRNFLWDHLNLSILHPHLRLLSPVVLLGTDSLWLCISWLNGQVPTSLTTSYLLLLSFTILASTTVYGKVSTGLLQNSWKRIHQVCSCNLQLNFFYIIYTWLVGLSTLYDSHWLFDIGFDYSLNQGTKDCPQIN